MSNKISEYIKRNANVPNVLTLIRLFLVPVYWIVFINYIDSRIICLSIFCVACITDFFDGLIARKHNLITDFGKLCDPLADKLMVVSVLISHCIKGTVDILPILIIAIKELLLIIGGFIMLKKYKIVVYSNFYGKAGMVSFVISLILLFFHSHWVNLGIPLDIIFVWLSLALSVLSFCIYAVEAYKKTRRIVR